ncbi:MAG: carboxynorspermidine decarboxylase [Proteobacteria bacterium]|nr:carboxynorspermidine decarboxylase [Pseudomonadota bacterium]
MERDYPLKFSPDKVETPCFVVDTDCLRHNLSILATVKQRTGCKILLALKGFAMHRVFPLIRETLDGICASSPDEARLGREEFQREVHTFAAAYSQRDMEEIITLSNHIVFNSFGQWNRFKDMIHQSGRDISCGIRVNPEHSEGATPIYDPCSPGSRLGVRLVDFKGQDLTGISGLHFHTLCEQNSDALERTVDAFERSFGPYIHGLSWINFGGGHHITRPDYDIDRLCRVIDRIKTRYGVQVYLEPGEAVALNAGVLVATVLDIITNDMPIAILDTSAATHMPDVIEMPYRPFIIGSGKVGEKVHSYRLGGLSCLAGDTIGEYSFDKPLGVGDKLVFTDMAIYSMVKTNTFNGVRLPSILLFDPEKNHLETVRVFGYDDYKNRLS